MALAYMKSLLIQSLNIVGRTSTPRRWKHYNPKFKWLRKMKYIDPGVDFNKKFTEEENRESMIERGYFPVRKAGEVPIYIDSSLQIFDAYVPKEGDGQYSSLTSKITSALSIKESALRKGKNMIALHKIRKYITNFDEDQFAQTALDIYIKAHTALASRNMDELEKYATENAISLMYINMKNKTVRWKYIESLDPPRTVHLRTAQVGSQDNLFAQMTVRFHSKQTLAIYDRFGRLIFGSEILAKDVLEYGVFEIHLSSLNGTYKLHEKIIPDWIGPKFPVERTFIKPKENEETDEEIGDEYKLISEIDQEKEVAKQ